MRDREGIRSGRGVDEGDRRRRDRQCTGLAWIRVAAAASRPYVAVASDSASWSTARRRRDRSMPHSSDAPLPACTRRGDRNRRVGCRWRTFRATRCLSSALRTALGAGAKHRASKRPDFTDHLSQGLHAQSKGARIGKPRGSRANQVACTGDCSIMRRGRAEVVSPSHVWKQGRDAPPQDSRSPRTAPRLVSSSPEPTPFPNSTQQHRAAPR